MTSVHLRGFFGGKDLGEVLVAFGHLEQVGTAYRVRGAEKYLRITEAQRAAGKANAGNLRRGASRAKAGGVAGAQPGPTRTPSRTPSRGPTPDTRAPTPESKSTAPASRVRQSDALVAAFKATTGRDYLWNGAKDGAAYAALLKVATPEEIERRWLLGLKGEGWRHTATIAQLRAKWNDLATAAPRPKGAAHLNGSGDTDWSNTPADYDGAAWLAEATGGTK